MATAIASFRKIPVTAFLIGALSLVMLAAGVYYLNRPAPAASEEGGASNEAKLYLPNLALSDVTMQATENFMNQQVVEVQGKIANHGPRKLALVEVYCLFYGVDGKEIYRERLAIAHGLATNETRTFRLPFDTLPDGWNQAMPRLAIAKISFATDMKLLLADDDADQLELRSLSLTQAGYITYTAADVSTALRVAEEQTPETAVVDLRIPTQADGLGLIRSLKLLDEHMRLIVLTGADAREFEKLPERALVEAVFTKGNAARQVVRHLRDGQMSELRTKLAQTGVLTLEVKVIPRSSKSEIVEFLADGSLKVKLASVPEKGKANDELIAVLAEAFHVRTDGVELIAGQTSQRKRLRIQEKII